MSLRRENGRNLRAVNENIIPRTQLSPQQLAVAFGLLLNALTVNSVLIDRDRRLQFVIGGSMEHIEEVFKALGITTQDIMKMF